MQKGYPEKMHLVSNQATNRGYGLAKRNLKIAMCTPMFKPVLGGAEQYIIDISDFLTKKGHRTDVFAFNLYYWKRSNFLNNESIGKIQISRFAVTPLSFLKHRLTRTMFLLTDPKKYIEKNTPDLLHFHNMTDFTFPLYMRKSRIPKILTCHTIHEEWASIIKRRVFLSKIISSIDYIHVFSEVEKKMLINSFRVNSERIRIIPNGVDPFAFKTSEEKNGNNILFVGRIFPTKGIHVLIEAVSKLNKKVELSIIGPAIDTNYLAALNSLARKYSNHLKISFLGKVSREELLNAYSKADVFVLPSLGETFPIVVLEAMASGVPIVASNVGGIPDMIMNGQNGFLVPPGESLAISSALDLLLEDQHLRALMGKRSKEIVLNKFSLEKNYSAIESLYEEVTG